MDDNPFLTEALHSVAQDVTANLFKLASLVVDINTDAVGMFAATTAVAIVGTGEHADLTNGYGLLYELATLVDVITPDGTDLEITSPTCGNPKCEHQHAVEAAFLEAAARSDGHAVINVLKAMTRESNSRNAKPELDLCNLYASVMVLVAGNVQARPT